MINENMLGMFGGGSTLQIKIKDYEEFDKWVAALKVTKLRFPESPVNINLSVIEEEKFVKVTGYKDDSLFVLAQTLGMLLVG